MMEWQSKAGLQLDSYLNELQRTSNLESLRPYMIREGCFLQQNHQDSAAITTEECKRLVRLWKLDHGIKNKTNFISLYYNTY